MFSPLCSPRSEDFYLLPPSGADLVPQLPPSHLFESSAPETLPSIVHASNISIPSSSGEKSNGFLIIEANGGLNQQRLSISDAVAVAGLLNATLVIPIFHLNRVRRDSRMKRGQKRSRMEKGSSSGTKAQMESTNSNSYLLFLDDYLKRARTAHTGPRFFVSKHSSAAAAAWKNMSDAERAPFLELGNQRKARKKNNVPKKKKTCTLPVFRSRCSPKAVVKLNESLNKEQRTAVQIVGFGSMLTLQCEILKREFISKLVHHFNPKNKTLEFGRMKVYSITPVDVGKALGLPLGTVPVPTNCEDFHYEHIRALFAKEDEQLKRGVTFGMMKEVFESGVADAKFQTSYVLFVLSALLCPTTKDVASTKFYAAVHDLTKISSYAWPQFVLDWLVKVITKFKNKDMKDVDEKKDAPGVSGCVLLLLLIYFDKEDMGMNVGSLGVPLIQSWTTNLIMERIAKEENLDLVDPISGQFPQPRLLHPDAQKAFHDLQKSFIVQMQHIIIMDASLMARVSETTRHKNMSKGKEVRDMDTPFDDYASHGIPSSSISTPKKATKGVVINEMEEDRITGFQNVQNDCDRPFSTPDHLTNDVVHTSRMEKCGSLSGVPFDQHKLNIDIEQVQQEVVGEMQGKVDREGEPVQLEIQVDAKGVVEERALTRPSKKRGNRTIKASKATRTPYVAEPEVKDSKFTKEELQLINFVMKPARKKEDMKGIVSMDGMMFNPSLTDLHNVFKERGRMTNLVNNFLLLLLCTSYGKVMDSIIVWLMKEEKRKASTKNGVPIPTRHMFSTTFMLFLPIFLATCEHWFCVVINLVEKRIDVLDSMNQKSEEKTIAIAEVVAALFSVLKRTHDRMEYPWTNWVIKQADVPQQNNLVDCGFYTLRFMEHWTGGRMNTREVEDFEDEYDRRMWANVKSLAAHVGMLAM
ncbi:hypothetical protein RHMOL_Rhmol07G0274900 [Rhododendron molle]|uniref:Uncharacterized protein n=1 Tax=Rhododendron molle TaxID=49168 RepID=A0ACC0N539_RHOML|nr:hypothetical protein RHMOL_Rhmol07G0274900 [Rhododendron molle]